MALTVAATSRATALPQERLHGTVSTPGDRDFGAVRRDWNGAVDRRPTLVARCADEQDVALAVRTATEHGLHLPVRGGGHDPSRSGDPGRRYAWSHRPSGHGRHGLALDNLAAVRVILADGTADAERHPDLYWVVRDGGGNFGVVTSARHRVHPIRRLVSGLMLFPLAHCGQTICWSS